MNTPEISFDLLDIVPKISIVIACYNDLYVKNAVESAYGQAYPNKEIIVIDDGSNPATLRVIESVDKYIDKLISQSNQGQGAARNRGIEEATGEFILNLDSDDFFEAGFCEKAVKKFLEDEDIKIVTCKARRFNEKGDIDIFTPRGGKIENFLFSNSALGSAMFRKIGWIEIGGYDESLTIKGYEDWELYIQLLKDGGVAYVIPEILFNYQVRQGSTTSKIKKLRCRKFQYIILKHKDLYKENFEDLMGDLFSRLNHLEDEKNRVRLKLDFKLGNFLLMPGRFIKSLFITQK